MVGIIKVLANTVTVNTSNTSVGSHLVRLLNTDTVFGLITIFDTIANSQIGTFQMVPNEVVYLQLRNGQVITGNNATKVFATPVAFTY